MTFADNTPNADTITAAAGTFRDAAGNNLAAGVQLTITSAGTNNGNTYTIASVSTDGSVATLVSSDAVTAETISSTAQAVTAVGKISVTPYFSGNQVVTKHRVDKTREFNFDLNAASAPFEKAIRALGVVAQGAFQTEGGLDQNVDRLSKALGLLDLALSRSIADNSPFGEEETAGSIEQAEIDLGYKRVLIETTNTENNSLVGFFESKISGIENVDPLEAVTKLLDEQRALETSFAAFARIRQLSLTNFL